jgi:CRP-like cAMP-binding protein
MSESVGRDLGDGEWLSPPEAPSDRLFLVQRGCLEIVSTEADEPLPLAELGPGDIVATASAGDAVGPLAIRARGCTRVLVLELPELERRLQEDPALSRTLIRSLSKTNARLSEALARRARASYVYVVPRDRPELYDRLREEFDADPQVTVVMDRREGERRQAEAAERRGPGRRADPGWSVYLSQPFKPGRGRFVPVQRKKGE